MAEGKTSFLLYTEILHTVNKLSDEQAGMLFKHILAYVNDENPVTDNIIIQVAFEPIKQSLKRDLRKYESICQRNKENGAKGGRPKENPNKPKKPSGLFGNPNKPKKADSDNDSDNDNDNDNVNDKKNIIPTLSEVQSYCRERNNNVDASRWYNFYEAKGWMIGKNKMKDWKAAVRTWEEEKAKPRLMMP